MYLHTRHGFFSIVTAPSDADEIRVRTRTEAHAIRAAELINADSGDDVDVEAADRGPGHELYPWGVVTDRKGLLRLLSALADDVVYSAVGPALAASGAYDPS